MEDPNGATVQSLDVDEDLAVSAPAVEQGKQGAPQEPTSQTESKATPKQRPNPQRAPRSQNNTSGPAPEGGEDAAKASPKPRAERSQPYIRPELEKRTQLSAEALSDKMEAMKIRNQKLAAQRNAALADEEEYAKSEEAANLARKQQQEETARRSRAQAAMQETINAERAQAAARKLSKMQGREWDSVKKETENWDPEKGANSKRLGPSVTGDGDDDLSYYYYNNAPQRTRGRGSSHPRGQSTGQRGNTRGGRGRGGNNSTQRAPSTVDTSSKEQFPELTPTTKVTKAEKAETSGKVAEKEASPEKTPEKQETSKEKEDKSVAPL